MQTLKENRKSENSNYSILKDLLTLHLKSYKTKVFTEQSWQRISKKGRTVFLFPMLL